MKAAIAGAEYGKNCVQSSRQGGGIMTGVEFGEEHSHSAVKRLNGQGSREHSSVHQFRSDSW